MGIAKTSAPISLDRGDKSMARTQVLPEVQTRNVSQVPELLNNAVLNNSSSSRLFVKTVMSYFQKILFIPAPRMSGEGP